MQTQLKHCIMELEYKNQELQSGCDSKNRKGKAMQIEEHFACKTGIQDIPHDILLDILIRLPIKSLILFKCSCRQWYRMVSDPKFIDMHLTRSIKNPGYLYVLWDADSSRYFVECQPDHVEAMAISRKELGHVPKEYALFSMCASAGGLLAFHEKEESQFYIWNPLIGEKVKVPKGPYEVPNSYEVHNRYFLWSWSRWGFGYSGSTREYKLIHFLCPSLNNFEGLVARCAIYTLGSENWREFYDFPFEPSSNSFVDCDGTLFCEVDSGFDEDIDVKESFTIGSFDIVSEQFRSWRGPIQKVAAGRPFHYLVKMGDTIACVRHNKTSHTIWTLRDKVKEIWTKDYEIVGCNLAFPEQSSYLIMRQLKFIGIWRNGNLFATTYSFSPVKRCVAYDTKEKELKFIWLPYSEYSDSRVRRSVDSDTNEDLRFIWKPMCGESNIPLRNILPFVGSIISPRRLMAKVLS